MESLYENADRKRRLNKMDARSAAIDAVINLIIAQDEDGAPDMKVVKATKKLTDIIVDKLVNPGFMEKLSHKQMNEIVVYLEMMLTGFNTFMEQFESTIEKENPHSSGN